MRTNITAQMLQRLPIYLSYLKALPKDDAMNISATALAQALGLNDVVVRKDLDAVSDGGRPKVGYVTEDLIVDLERALGYDDMDDAVLVGVGKLGKALMSYDGFSEYGLNIIAGFDVDEDTIGTHVNGKEIFALDKLEDICKRRRIRIGVITVPAIEAQQVCDGLVAGGVKALWNFAPVHLNVPEDILVQNENMAASLAALSRHLTEKIYR